MRAIILAAGIGYRLGGGPRQPPKSLLEFDGCSLLERHLRILSDLSVSEVAIGVGYRAPFMREALRKLSSFAQPAVVHNPDFEEGNIVTLWQLRSQLREGGEVLLMDADVLYDRRLMQRLLDSRHENCFLLDRRIEPGDEPVKLCIRDGRPVEFRKIVEPGLSYDFHGESVGFFKLSEATALALADRCEAYVDAGRREEYYEEAIRDLLFTEHRFGFEDITGLPWIEIDFPEDIERARREVLPQFEAATDRTVV